VQVLTSNWTDVSVQHLPALVSWHMFDHVTTQVRSFMLYSCWDSVCFVIAVSVLLVNYFVSPANG